MVTGSMTTKDWQSLSVLIVGCGSIGRRHARVLAALGVRDIRACDPNAEQLAALVAESPQVRAVASFEAGLAEKPDAVFVLTPPKMHVPMSMTALHAGCAVFCEKPIADTSDGIDALTALVASTGLPYMVGLCFRFHAGVRAARALLDAGEIGRLVSVRALFGEHMPDVRPDYRSLFSAQYSGAFDCTHDIDLAVWFAGQRPERVQATYGNFSDIGIKAPDVAEIILDFPDRCIGSVHLDFFQRPRRRQIDLIGTDGVILLEFASWDTCTVSVWTAKTKAWEHTTIATRRDDMFADEDREFLEAVTGVRTVTCTIAEALRSLEVVEAAQRG